MFIFAHHPNYRNGQRDLMPFSRGGETEAQSKKLSCECRRQDRKCPHVFCLQLPGSFQGSPFLRS